jgi:hypothetical protein
MTSNTKMAVRAASDKNGIWQVIQIFDRWYWKPKTAPHPPSVDEMRNISYQALIGGSKGLVFYAYHWLFYGKDAKGKNIYSEKEFNKRWPDVVKVIKEIKSITPIILDNNKVTIKSTGSALIQYQAWRSNNKLYVLIANTEKAADTINLKIPAGWKLDDKPANGITALLKGGELNVNCSAFASGVLIFNK